MMACERCDRQVSVTVRVAMDGQYRWYCVECQGEVWAKTRVRLKEREKARD